PSGHVRRSGARPRRRTASGRPMPFATVADVRLYWERVGDPDGPPVLFVNGTGGDLRARPSPLEGPLAEGFDLVGYDQRGLGQSDNPDEAYSMAGYAADALGLVD